MQTRRTFLGCAALALTASMAAYSVSPAYADVLAMAADKPGTTFNAIASGAAKIMSENSDHNIVVRAYAGPAAWLPVMEQGEVHLGAVSANSAWQAFTGEGNVPEPAKDFRILRSGSGSLFLGFVVRADTDIQSVSDLKGKRVASDYGGHASISRSLDAALQVGHLTWDDVTAVPVVGANDGIEALEADRVDASWSSLGQPRTREADVKVGIRHLPFPETDEAVSIFREHIFPGAQIAVVPEGSAPGVVADTPMLTYDSYLVVHKDVSDETVHDLLEALWENTEELRNTHRGLSGFTQDAAVTDVPVVPYHPAAVEFYKEKDLWNEEVEQRQQALLSEASQ
jgi:TRAP transporter TAXI family solute receptor